MVYEAGEFIGNKILDTVTQQIDYNIENKEPVKEIIIPPEKRDEFSNKLWRVL